MSEYVYIVTDSELGWDCVVGVYATYERALEDCKPDPEEYAEDPEFFDPMLDHEGKFKTRHIFTKQLEA